jgi:exopolysaccharide biosynthesis polyprenyl glycosylphosphotransferase
MTTSHIGGRIGLQWQNIGPILSPQKHPRANTQAIDLTFLSIADFFLVWVAAFVAWWIRFATGSQMMWGHEYWRVTSHHWAFLYLYSVLFLLFAYAKKLYVPPRRPEFSRQAMEVIKVSLIAAFALTAFIYVSGDKTISRGVIGGTFLLSVALLIGWRAFLRFPGVGGLTEARNVLIVGAGPAGRALQQYLEETPQLGYSVKGFVDRRSCQREPLPDNSSPDKPILGGISNLESILRVNFIDEVLVTLPTARDLIKEVVARAQLFGTQVRVVTDLYDGLALGAPIESVGQFPTVTLHSQPIPALQLTIKRSTDAIFSAIALSLLSPVFLLIAILIKLDSKGSVFYSSVRLGKKGNTFICHKFRTMVADAEKQKESLQHLNERDGILFKISNDPRITKLGRFLRKWSLDELPQLWNVLKGDMSLVGPRPPIPEEYKKYAVEHLRRLEVVPGLTGLWQVYSRQSPSFDDYIRLDLQYVDSWSVWLDVTLIARTLYVVLAGTGR